MLRRAGDNFFRQRMSNTTIFSTAKIAPKRAPAQTDLSPPSIICRIRLVNHDINGLMASRDMVERVALLGA